MGGAWEGNQVYAHLCADQWRERLTVVCCRGRLAAEVKRAELYTKLPQARVGDL